MSYVGQRRHDYEPHGFGVCYYISGSKYEGEWRAGRPGPFGVHSFANKGTYNGAYADTGQRSGAGVFTYEGVGKYEGYHQADLTHGKGVLVYPNNDVFSGEFYKGKRDGFGVFVEANGSVFEGSWKGDAKHVGTCRYRNGDVYAGQWYRGYREGKGVMQYGNGSKYFGELCRNHLHGDGELVSSDGQVVRGLWNSGVYVGEVELDEEFCEIVDVAVVKAMDIAARARELLPSVKTAVKEAQVAMARAQQSAQHAGVIECARQAREKSEQVTANSTNEDVLILARKTAQMAIDLVTKRDDAEKLENRINVVEAYDGLKFGKILYGPYSGAVVDLVSEVGKKYLVVLRTVPDGCVGARECGQEIYVLKDNVATYSTPPLMSGATASINVVKTAEELHIQLSNHLSLSVAQSIIDYRNRHAPFETWEELLRVPGVTQRLSDQMRAVFCLTYYDETSAL